MFLVKKKVDYLGHLISKGVQIDEREITTMKNWPRPTNVTELKGFLGLTSYDRKFVLNCELIVTPLTQLLKKGQFCWDEMVKKAFKELKFTMTITLILVVPNFNELFVLETDVSDGGIGVILSKQSQPVAFLIRALSPRKQA